MNRQVSAIVLALALATTGCDREADIAREAANRQAEQNRTMAQLQQEVAVGTRRLAENDAKAREQALAVHQELQVERAELGDGWNSLEAQRQSIARERRTDSFLSALVTGGGATLAALFALAFAWLALFGQSREDDAAELCCELLAEELLAASDHPSPPDAQLIMERPAALPLSEPHPPRHQETR